MCQSVEILACMLPCAYKMTMMTVSLTMLQHFLKFVQNMFSDVSDAWYFRFFKYHF